MKIGKFDYLVAMNNSPDVIEAINSFPIKWVAGREVFMRDVAHVHDGFQVQTNSVSVDGVPGALMTIRNTGGVSTLAVINGIRAVLPEIRHMLPAGVRIKPIFDQSVFVKAALNSVLMGGALAAGLTALMILLFLGNWRLTVMILAAIPLSIISAVLLMGAGGETLNTMTLGGFALAVGILVDNGTVVIENIERHAGLRPQLSDAIVNGCAEVGTPTFLSTLCICIVFVPVFLLQGTAKYLFSPLSVSVIVSLLASLALSFTMVPVLFLYLMRSQARPAHGAAAAAHGGSAAAQAPRVHPLLQVHLGFERGFQRFREAYRNALAWALSQPKITVLAFLAIMLVSLPLFPLLGRDFFPDVDAGEMRLHVRAPPGTRIETTQQYFSQVEATIRELVGNDQISVILDNIGLPYSGINIALSDSATVGPMDGEILISLQKKHAPTADLTAMLRRELPQRFPALQFFFQPADIVDQVLNFGQPAPIDIRVTASDTGSAYRLAARLTRLIARIPGVVDAHVFQVPDAPALSLDVDRALATQVGLTQRDAASNVLVTTNSSAQTAPNFWVDPSNGVSYPLVVQQPTYDIASSQDLKIMPVSSADGSSQSQLLMNLSSIGRRKVPMVTSQLNIRPVFDVHANVQGRDLYSTSRDIDRVIAANQPPAAEGDAGDLERPGGDDARELHRTVHRHRARGRAGLPVSGDQLPELDRSAHRADGGAVHAERCHVDVVPDPDAPERAGSHGHAHVDRTHHRQQHPGRELRQSAHGSGRRSAARRGDRRLHPLAPGADDGRRHDPRHGADGDRRGRGGRAERAARPRGDRRPVVCNLRDAGVRADHVPAAAAAGAARHRRAHSLRRTAHAREQPQARQPHGPGRDGPGHRICRGHDGQRVARGIGAF